MPRTFSLSHTFVIAVRFAATLLAAAYVHAPLVSAAEKPNVLFIAVDDLNDWIGCLGGHPQAKTPNIDALAARGVNFTHAYCASPVCNPSRTALMTGLRSSSSGVYGNDIHRGGTVCKDVVPLNSHFQDNGYFVAAAGKIYHGPGDQWGKWSLYGGGEGGSKAAIIGDSDGVGGIKFAPTNGTDDSLADYGTVEFCIKQLNKKHDKPFFLACGLTKPHMPWNVPQKYYDLFPADSIELPKVLETDLDDVPAGGKKMANPQGDHAAMLKSGRWKDAVRGYLAAGAYCDAMVGKLMAAFDECPNKENTIIVFWGDHGWHLGEKQHWRKFALWEEATRAPLFYVAPGVTKPKSVCVRTVDFMSIYPTLCELCGLDRPEHVEGVSIKKLLADPQAAWDTPALTTHGMNNHAVRTEKWRYIRYADGGEELYDEVKDPLEWKNLANDPQFASVKSELAVYMPQKNVQPGPGAGKEDGKPNKKKKAAKQAAADK